MMFLRNLSSWVFKTCKNRDSTTSPFSHIGTEENSDTVASFHIGLYMNKRQKWIKIKVEAKPKQISNPNTKRNADFCWQISV